MKITCHACGAKYAIADEKVRGRRVKVRCKSCSEPIIVDGYVEQQAAEPDEDERTHMVASSAAAAAPPADSWSVNVSDTDQRTMTTDELVSAWNAGQLPQDTYVWKEGMADWAPVTSTPDLLPYLTAGADSAPVAAAAPAYTPIGAQPSAARVAGGRGHGGADLFGAAAAAADVEGVVSSAPAGGGHSPPQPGSTGYADKMTGARNENSVLFSLDSLKAGLGSAPAARSAPTASRPSAPKQDTANLDDIMDMGGGMNPLFALQQNQSLLSAPPPPPDPPPRPAFPSDPAMVGSFSPMPAPKSNNKLIIAVGGAVALVAILAVVIGVVVVKSGGDSAVAKSETAAKLDAKADKSDKKKDEGATRPASAEKPDETSKDEAAPAGSAGTAEKKPVTEEDKKRFAEAQAKKKEEAAKAGDTAKTEEVTKKEAPSSGVASFNKGAAIAALGAAAAQASGCKRPGGPTGGGRAVVTFAPSGRVTSATVSGGDFPGTPVGSCVASVFRRANVPPFSGDAVTVSKAFSIAP